MILRRFGSFVAGTVFVMLGLFGSVSSAQSQDLPLRVPATWTLSAKGFPTLASWRNGASRFDIRVQNGLDESVDVISARLMKPSDERTIVRENDSREMHCGVNAIRQSEVWTFDKSHRDAVYIPLPGGVLVWITYSRPQAEKPDAAIIALMAGLCSDNLEPANVPSGWSVEYVAPFVSWSKPTSDGSLQLVELLQTRETKPIDDTAVAAIPEITRPHIERVSHGTFCGAPAISAIGSGASGKSAVRMSFAVVASQWEGKRYTATYFWLRAKSEDKDMTAALQTLCPSAPIPLTWWD